VTALALSDYFEEALEVEEKLFIILKKSFGLFHKHMA